MSFEFLPVGRCESVWVSPGFYILEVWGAQGGTQNISSSGRGGYSQAIYHVSERKNLTVCVGKSGGCSDTESVPGGFNGGGNSQKTSLSYYRTACSGGGATDIRTSESPEDRIIVAGGGGGYASHHSLLGGFGGGLNGGTAFEHPYSGTGATSTEPGKGGSFPGSDTCDPCEAGDGDRQGNGGNACATAVASAGGGGGGYYGGGGGADYGSGGGGSGFIDKTLTRKKLYSGNQQFFSPKNELETGHIGDGYARILPLCVATRKYNHLSMKAFHILFISIINAC